MSDKHEAVNIFPSHVEAETAVLELQKAGFNMQQISIIGKDYQTTEHIRGFLTWKDTAKAGAGEAGYWGTFFGGLFGILTGVGLLFIPGVGPVIVAGHVAGVLAGWLEGMGVGGVGAAVGHVHAPDARGRGGRRGPRGRGSRPARSRSPRR